MTNEERDLISQFVARVGGGAPQGGFSRSVPATVPALPPIDPEADRFIAEQFSRHPEARYRVTQMAVVQEAALAEATNRIQQLQQALQQAQQGPQQSKGFFSSLFGGGAGGGAPQQGSPWNQGGPGPGRGQYAPPPNYQPNYPPSNYPPPNYPPNVQPGMFQQGGSGFLGSALTTAAGVAGGMVAGNALMGLFSGGGHGGMFGGGSGMPQETIITNNYGSPAEQGMGGQDAGGWDNNAQSAPDPGWDSPAPDAGGGGWDDSSGGGGGWDDNSNT